MQARALIGIPTRTALYVSLRAGELHGARVKQPDAMAMSAAVVVALAALAGPNPPNLLELECKLKHAACLFPASHSCFF